MTANTSRPGRRTGTSTTRAEILTAARAQFAEHGYDGSSLRAIGTAAGVDAAMISYFFGSKGALFREALELPMDPAVMLPVVLDGDPAQVGHRLATLVAQVLSDDQMRQRIVALIRSASRENAAAELIRDTLTDALLIPIAEHLGAPDAAYRAGLAMSQIAGLTLARHVIGLAPLAEAGTDELVAALGPTLQRYLTGDLT